MKIANLLRNRAVLALSACCLTFLFAFGKTTIHAGPPPTGDSCQGFVMNAWSECIDVHCDQNVFLEPAQGRDVRAAGRCCYDSSGVLDGMYNYTCDRNNIGCCSRVVTQPCPPLPNCALTGP